MSLNDFIINVIELLEQKLGDSIKVVPRKITKNNSVELDCLVIGEKSSNIFPSIYVNSFYLEYLNGRSLESITDDIIRLYNDGKMEAEDGEFSSFDFKDAEQRVILRLINYEKNLNMLRKVIYDKVNDLAVTYHFVLSKNGNGLATVKLDENNCGIFGLTPESIRKNALKNTMALYPPEFNRLEDILRRVYESACGKESKLPFEVKESFGSNENMQMYVLTTRSKVNGASCILYEGILQRIQETLNSGYYIIPSSINEVLILPDSEMIEKEYLDSMVKEVNREHVPETEILSDRIYHFPEDQFLLSVPGSGETAVS